MPASETQFFEYFCDDRKFLVKIVVVSLINLCFTVLTFGAWTQEGNITVCGMNVTVQLPFPNFLIL